LRITGLSHAIQTLELTKRFPGPAGLGTPLRSFRGEEVVAVDSVTLSVRRGELFGLMGPNGAGKTTLIKLLCTLVIPTSGAATVSGFALADGENVRRHIGLVGGEERSFYWRLTGRENLRFYASLYGLSRSQTEKRLRQLSVLLGLEEVLDQRFDRYSAGMKQRLALARGLLNEAEVLFLDEPTKSLDPTAAMRLRETIRDLAHSQGRTVVLVTHQLSEAEQICDRIGIMHRGKLRVTGDIGRLREFVKPEERYSIQVVDLSAATIDELQRLEGVVDLTAEARGPNRVALDLRLVEGTVTLAPVLRMIMEAGGEIESIKAEEVTLEEIFEEFTGDRAYAEAGPSEFVSLPSIAPEELSPTMPRNHEGRGLVQKVLVSFRRALSFVERDFKLQVSYRLSFFLQFFGILFTVASFYFVALLFGEAAVPHLQAYGGDYFSFVLVGIAFMRYQGVAMSTFTNTIRSGQMMGTLEAMLVTPTSLATILVSSSLWSFAFTSFHVLVYLLLGVLLFGVDMGNANVLAAVIIQVLTILAFSGIGILSASFTMVFKRGDPINFLFGSVSTLLGGVLYPVTVLPALLQPISYLLPLTYSLRAMRRAILLGDSVQSLVPDILALACFAALLLPLSFVAFRYAVRRAKIEGSLTQY
jgi:ABC-2 type transport system permease protein